MYCMALRPLSGGFLIPPALPVESHCFMKPPPLAVRLEKALPFRRFQHARARARARARPDFGAWSCENQDGREFSPEENRARARAGARARVGEEVMDCTALRPLSGGFLIPPALPVESHSVDRDGF